MWYNKPIKSYDQLNMINYFIKSLFSTKNSTLACLFSQKVCTLENNSELYCVYKTGGVILLFVLLLGMTGGVWWGVVGWGDVFY